MITRNNLRNVVNLLSEKDKKRVLNSNKEYAVLCLHIFNIGCNVTVRLTNNYNRYKNVYKSGAAILYTEEIQDLINGLL